MARGASARAASAQAAGVLADHVDAAVSFSV
jgi:hypothetical protein